MSRSLFSFAVAFTALAASTASIVLPAFAAPPEHKGKAEKPTPKACPRDKVWSESRNGCVCGPGSAWDTATRKCVAEGTPAGRQNEGARTADKPAATESAESKPVEAKTPPPAPAPPPPVSAPAGSPSEPRTTDGNAQTRDDERAEEAPDARPVEPPEREQRDVRGNRSARRTCASGARPSRDGRCPPLKACPAGTHRLGTGLCVSDAKTCPEGREWKDAWAACVPACPPGQVLDFMGQACHLIKRRSPR
jgi:outer membrane biosynthesis protein TonB